MSLHLHQTVSGGADEHLAVLAFQQAGDVAGNNLLVQVVGGDGTETLTVENLEGTVHADEETAIVVLCHAVDIVAGHAEVLASLLFIYTELVAVIAVQSITGGYPDETVFIQINLCCEATRHLFVGIKELSHLGINTQAA